MNHASTIDKRINNLVLDTLKVITEFPSDAPNSPDDITREEKSACEVMDCKPPNSSGCLNNDGTGLLPVSYFCNLLSLISFPSPLLSVSLSTNFYISRYVIGFSFHPQNNPSVRVEHSSQMS